MMKLMLWLLFAILIAVIPTVMYVLPFLIKRKLTKITAAQKREEKKTFEKEIAKVYLDERIQYYQDAHYIFNQQMRAGKLSRSDILKLKKMINAALGSYCKEYEKRVYKNDCHEIYSKLKNHHIDKGDWIKIIQFLTLKAEK